MAMELTQLVAVRVSAETAQAWRDAAQRQGVGLSDLIRTRMAEPGQEPERTGRPTPARGPGRGSAPKADPQLVGELARIGNNLNQIARRANTAKAVDVAMLATLQGIAEQLDATLVQVVRGGGSASDEKVVFVEDADFGVSA